jgi:NADPH:quinone reductase-like Zn-dependent oxidoreductase
MIVTHYGRPEALRVVEEECPEPKDGEVRVRVLAAGVSLPDRLMREGVHPETPRLPFTPGWDLVELLQQQRIKPLIARRFPLAEARHAHELLGKGGVTGKIVLVCNGSSPGARGSMTTASS